ncbi:hypothetical protein THAR02_09123 [Trichoderma harzianum]|uniref:Uncharacterized protein n=1 Tax=Trichoderma harzianum TaxID=5544 RepID=A0A0G0A018_TRIHA|nr:hypothetical protein THAR02_09123 [Trichoderma harzianum]
MSGPSTCSVCIGSTLSQSDKEHRITTTNHVQSFEVLHDPTYNMDRFLQHNSDKAGQNYQRPLPGLGEPQSEIEAEKRMLGLIQTFDERFGQGGSPSGS